MKTLATTVSLLLIAGACAETPNAALELAPSVPGRPASCREVSGGDLGQVLTTAGEGEALCLAPGRWRGPVVIARAVSVWGPRDAIVYAAEPGSIITITGPRVSLSGFSVDGRGGRFDKFDAAVHVMGDDARVAGLDIVHAVYGVLVEKVKRATVTGNRVRGDAETAMGMRGDTIRLWETYDSVVVDNLVEDGRDMVVWYSSRNLIARNRVLRGRYGTHFMYSHDNEVSDNAYVDSVVGVFVMYSKRDVLRRNAIFDADGASGMGIGLKDSGDITIEDNVLVHDTVGLYVDNTPGQADETLVLGRNFLRHCTTALHFHTTPRGTTIAGNDLADNGRQVPADAGTHSDQARWTDNYYDDYAGYDLDGDDVGDLPYRSESASEDLVAQHEELAFFHGSPALALIDLGSHLLPLWEPRVLLVDDAPRMSPRPLPRLPALGPMTGSATHAGPVSAPIGTIFSEGHHAPRAL